LGMASGARARDVDSRRYSQRLAREATLGASGCRAVHIPRLFTETRPVIMTLLPRSPDRLKRDISRSPALRPTFPDSEYVSDYLARSVTAMRSFSEGEGPAVLARMAERVTSSMRAGGKLLICGNGGSAADAQHIAGEFISRLMYDRRPLPSVALTTDSSALTATGNDYGYEHVFERQVLGLGLPGDVLLGISTSGRSPNVLRALEAARGHGLVTTGFAGQHGGPMRELCDVVFEAPSDHTPIIQQIHITAAHILCALVERAMCPRNGEPRKSPP
jgi:D-sedoheptulose 7-phosphate isomerase